jgi:transcriptional regulator with XRE-family HTH domain
MNFGEHSLSKATTLSREQVRLIFHRFRGSQRELAEDLGVGRSAVTNWLDGKPSQRIGRAAPLKAMELMASCAENGKSCEPCPIRSMCEEFAFQASGVGAVAEENRRRRLEHG